MIATPNQPASKDSRSINVITEERKDAPSRRSTFGTGKLRQAQFLPSRLVTHSPQAGLNPLVDAAGYLFSVIGKLKLVSHYRNLNQLQKELIQEINLFLSTIKHHGYNAEYVMVCRYILCATFDDVIANTPWGSQGQWQPYCLLASFNQDLQHHDKLFTILDRAINEPATYIDLMELMYICLSLGYKGQYRGTEYNQYQLEQITHNLYKHIQVYKGGFSKTLSPTPLKPVKPQKRKSAFGAQFIFVCITTTCIIMSIFVGLGYLTDVISNEVYKNITQTETPVI